MGGKARTIFGTVLSFASLLITGNPAVALWIRGAVAGTALLYGAWAAKEARRKAEAAIQKNDEGRKTMLRGGAVAKYFVYGREWVPGVVVGHREPQSKSDPYFWLVLALPVAHKIESIEQIWFGDEQITPLTADGAARLGTFNKEITRASIAIGVIPANRIVTVRGLDVDSMDQITVINATLAITANVPATYPEGEWQDVIDPDATVTLVPGTTNQFQISGGTAGVDKYTITYTYKLQRAYIKCWQYFGDDEQVANQELINATAHLPAGDIQRWTATDQLNGVPYVIMRFHVDKDVFPNGLDNIAMQIQGKRQILDTRDGVERWTDNSALCIRDYALAQCGVLAGDIDLNRLHAQANYCDIYHHITLPTGESADEYNYRTNIALSTEAKPIDNLGLLLSSCDGSAGYSGQGFDIRVGMYEDPDIELDDSDFAGPPTVVKGLPRMELFNGVRARYSNSAKPFWPLEDCPAYASKFYRDKQQIGEVIREIDLQGTASAYMAHRICKQTLLRAMQGQRLSALFKPKAMMLSPEQRVRLSCRSLGSDQKVYRVLSIRPKELHQFEVEFQEDAPELYQWDFDEAAGVDPAPNTSLPSIRDVPLIEGLGAHTNEQAMVVGPDGNIIPCCLVFWAPVTNLLVLHGGHIEVRHKRTQDADWTYSGNLAPTSTEFRFPIQRGDVILIEVRCANSYVPGEWLQIKRTTENTPAPYIVSQNELRNAKFAYTMDGDDHHFTDWNYYYDSGMGGILSYDPFPMLQGPNLEQTGVVQVQRVSSTAGRMGWFESSRMTVMPGRRMVAFVYGLATAPQDSVRLAVSFYNLNGTLFLTSYSGSLRGTWTSSQLDPENWPVLLVFVRVPAGAYAAAMRLEFHEDGSASGLRSVRFRRPFLGEAAEGQISIPPWRA